MTSEMIFFLDIETAQSPQYFSQLPEDGKYAFRKKFRAEIEELQNDLPIEGIEEIVWKKNAALYAEYNVIVCLSLGFIHEGKLRIKTLHGKEKDIIIQFAEHCKRFDFLCAHNGMEFDFPILTRKYFMHRVKPPRLLDNFGKKPWDMALLDTSVIWKASSYKSYTSLVQIAYALGLPTPKDEMAGHEVPEAFYQGRVLDICTYCEKDVVTLANIFRILRSEPVFEPTNVEYINYTPA